MVNNLNVSLSNLKPDVSVIIISFNTLDYLKRSIASVALGFQRHTFEIIVVDNGSTDGSLEYLRSEPFIRLIENQENRGFPVANNQAMEIAVGQHYFLLNSDAFLHESCGDLMLDFLLTHPRVGLVVSTFEFLHGGWQQSFGDFPTLYRGVQKLLGRDILETAWYNLMHRWGRNILRPQRVDYGEGAGLLIRGQVKQDIGGLSADYFFYGDDVDYALRASKANWGTWWLPQAHLTHVRGGSLRMKDYEAALKKQYKYFMRFWVSNYSPRSVRVGYILKCLYWQRMVWGARFLAWLPVIGNRVQTRLQKYQIARDMHWQNLPKDRYDQLIQSVKADQTTV